MLKKGNGFRKFQRGASAAFSALDSEKRKFEVKILPKKYLSYYNRDKQDYGQVLVSAKVKD